MHGAAAEGAGRAGGGEVARRGGRATAHEHIGAVRDVKTIL